MLQTLALVLAVRGSPSVQGRAIAQLEAKQAP
jgi:hypothetical protein